VDLFNEAAKLRGVQLKWVMWHDAPEELYRQGKADLLLMSVVTPERARSFYLTEPWLRIEGQLVWRKSPGERGLPNFAGKQIGVPGYRLYETIAKKNFTSSRIVRRASRIELLEMVCKGELDAAVVDARSVTMMLLDRPEVCNGVQFGMNHIEETDDILSIMSRKDAQWAADELRAGISDLSANGRMRAIYEQWGVGFMPEVRVIEEVQKAKRQNDILRNLLIGTAILLGAIAVLAMQLRRALRAADRASKAKSSFLATTSHETRTPLKGIIGLAEALSEDSTSDEQKRMASSIAQCGKSLVSLVNDVLDHSKLEAGKLDLVAEPFSMAEMMDPIAASLGIVARQKGIEFRCEIDPALPEWMEGDAHRLTQVLFNLVGNAIKFAAAGHVAVKIAPTGDLVRFEVADTGIGMSLVEQAQLFEAFWQAKQDSTRVHGGTGLGLSISRRLVEKMGGEIGVKSAPGVGSKFWFELRLPSSVAPKLTTVTTTRKTSGPLRILFADDNEVNQRVVERLLLKLGHEVDLAADGKEAVDKFEVGGYDLVLMDCQMPVEDGFSAARRIRQIEAATGKNTPILALTALAFPEDRERCLKAGMNGHLCKPVSLKALEDGIAE